MTGYGRADGEVAGQPYSIEVRCLNHRYRDVRLNLPRQWLELEVEIDRLVRKRIGRGRVECSVRSVGSGPDQGMPVLDEDRLEQFQRAYSRASEVLGIDEAPSLGILLRAEGVISFRPEVVPMDQVRAQVEPLIEEALGAADAMRKREGQTLDGIIRGHLKILEGLLVFVRAAIPEEQKAMQARTADRVQALSADAEVNEDRLAQELAVLAERADVTEEIARLGSHTEQFAELLERQGPIGRELDFLLQEMNREVNTLCSKFHSAPVVRKAVTAKAELEKVREQIQNVE